MSPRPVPDDPPPKASGAGERLWGIFPAEKQVRLDRLAALAAEGPALAPEFVAAVVDDNPWLAALGRLGYRAGAAGAAIDPRMVPVEEGESSLNANPHQALAALLVLVEGAAQGLAPTVVGDLTLGNHSLDHSVERFAAATPDPARARRAFHEALGPPALAAAAELLAARGRPAQKAFARLPPAVQVARALRLPATLVAAPDAGSLAALAAAVGLDGELAAELAAIREAMAEVGLRTFGDLLIVARSAWIRRAAAMLGRPAVNHLPVSFEHLVTRATPAGFAGRTLRELAASYHALLAAGGSGRPGGAYGPGRYRLLNVVDPARALGRGGGPEGGRRRDPGWEVVEADFETGEPVASRSAARSEAGGGAAGWAGGGGARAGGGRDGPAGDLADLPLAELLARGYGLSGKLIYLAGREINRGRVCLQVFRSKTDVYLGLADPGHPVRALPLARVYPRVDRGGGADAGVPAGAPGPGGGPDRVSPDFGLFLARLRRHPDPVGALSRIYAAFRAAVADPEAPDGRLWIEVAGGRGGEEVSVRWVPAAAEG